MSFAGSSAGKEFWIAGNPSSIPGLERFNWKKDRLPTPVFTGFPGGSDGKEPAPKAGDLGLNLRLNDPLQEGIATHSVFLPGESSQTEEPGGLQSMGSQRVRHD